jgi:hypothetical protein
MLTTTGTHRRLTSWMVVAAVCAGFATAAQAAGPAESRYSAPELRALTIRSKALNCLYVRADACFNDAALRALTIRSEAMNRLYGS